MSSTPPAISPKMASSRSRAELRKHPRICYREGVNVTVMQEGRVVAAHFVLTNDISARGLGFSYRGHLQPGTRIEVKLCRRDARQDVISGTVTHCARLGIGVNMVGVRLDRAIDPSMYMDPAGSGSKAGGRSD